MAATTVAFSDLDTWLRNHTPNTPATAYELRITGLTQESLKSSNTNNTLGYILKLNNTKYEAIVLSTSYVQNEDYNIINISVNVSFF